MTREGNSEFGIRNSDFGVEQALLIPNSEFRNPKSEFPSL